MDDPVGSILVILLFVLAAIVRIALAAIPFLDETEIERRAQSGERIAKRGERLIARSEAAGFGELQMSWLCLILIDFYLAVRCIYPCLNGVLADAPNVRAAAFVVIYIVLAFALTGVMPERLAAHGRQKLFDRVAPVAEWTVALLSPISKLSLLLGRVVLKPLRMDNADSSELVTEEDILEMVDIGEEKGAIESDEKEMIENIFEFNNMDAGDCMVHRKDIIAIGVDSTDEEIMTTIVESGRSRFPVYENTIDNVLGVLFTRDYLMQKCRGESVRVRKLIRPAYYVPESVPTDVLFKEMQSRKQHIAIVVDEYGGTSGLITLEDLLEQIVGNIYDEYDPKEDEDIQPLSDGRWRVSGAAELETVGEALNVPMPEDEEFDTLGGLVFSLLTEIPADGEQPVVECFGLRISVESIADRRVEWAVVEKLEPTPATDAE